MFQSPTRSALAIVAALALPLGATACGGSDDADTDSSTAAGADVGAAGVDISTVATCLENRGFEVVREEDQDPALVLPDEYKESVGIVDGLSLGSLGSVKGIGAITVFTDADAAEEEEAAAAGFRTDDVQAGTIGVANWNYVVTAGDDPGVTSMITACLT